MQFLSDNQRQLYESLDDVIQNDSGPLLARVGVRSGKTALCHHLVNMHPDVQFQVVNSLADDYPQANVTTHNRRSGYLDKLEKRLQICTNPAVIIEDILWFNPRSLLEMLQDLHFEKVIAVSSIGPYELQDIRTEAYATWDLNPALAYDQAGIRSRFDTDAAEAARDYGLMDSRDPAALEYYREIIEKFELK